MASRLQEYLFLSKHSFSSLWAAAIFVCCFLKRRDGKTNDVIIPVYSEYSAHQSRMFGIYSPYSGIRIATQSNGHSSYSILFFFRNKVNRTHPKSVCYGCKYEEYAVKAYETHMKKSHVNFQVTRCGLFTNSSIHSCMLHLTS